MHIPKGFDSKWREISTVLRPKRLIDFVRIRSIFFLRHCVIIRRNLGRSYNSRLLVCSFEGGISVIFPISTPPEFLLLYQKVSFMAICFCGSLERLSFSCCTAINISSEIMASWEPV